MKQTLTLCLALLATVLTAATSLAAEYVVQAKGGPIRITPIFHASLQIEYRGMVIHVDPFSQGDYSKAKKADIILITHSHPDHFDVKAMRNVRRRVGTEVVAPLTMDAQIKQAGFYNLSAGLSNGSTLKPQSGVRYIIEAVPMYNIARERKPGQKYHPKGEFNGYVLTLGGKRIYIAGDTEATPEMKALKNIDVAFLPMNLPYTMTPQEAAEGAKAFKPHVAIPYHYRSPFDKKNDNPYIFKKALEGTPIKVVIMPWYPAKP